VAREPPATERMLLPCVRTRVSLILFGLVLAFLGCLTLVAMTAQFHFQRPLILCHDFWKKEASS